MKKILLLCFLVSGLSCSESTYAQHQIDADQVEKMLQTDSTIQLVDLRTPEELQKTGRITGALAINYNSPDFKKQIAGLDKGKPVIIYCASGGRSGRALPQMVKTGFKNVYEYPGGMNDWTAKGKKTVH